MHESESDLPVTVWLEDVKGGDEQAFARLWSQYYSRLVSLARKNMGSVPNPIANEEDIVESAMASFYFRARDGRYPDLRDRHGLWKLLISITLTKARALARKEGRRREILEREFSGQNFAQGEPAPEFAAEVADQLRQLLDALPDPLLREIAVAKLEGYTNQEIAASVGKAVPTIERKLRLIRDAWTGFVSQ
jgi:DNA-directed RNA polymerase specialized sigma24 family protein